MGLSHGRAMTVPPTVHSVKCQDLDLILHWLLQHGNRRERKERVLFASLRPTETFMRACPRPTEAACLHVRKCVNKSQLIVAGIHRFFRYTYAYAARFRMRIYTQNAACATYTYANTDWHFLVHGNGHTHACLTQG